MWVIVTSAEIFSLSKNLSDILSSPVCTYWTYRNGCVVVVPAANPTTCALTPEVAPVNNTGLVALKNWLTFISSPPNVDSSARE